MLMPTLPHLLKPGSEHGFTLMETLVAMVTGVIVTGALLAILEVSLRQQTRITERVQADQAGRTAMSNMIDELHSSCTGATPIQAPKGTVTKPLLASGPLNLWFVSAYGVQHGSEPLLNEAYQHDLNWETSETSNTGEQLGTLRDYSFKNTGNSTATEWKFPGASPAEATSVKVLAKNVIAPKSGAIFQYYKYTSSGQLTELASSELPLTETTAKSIAKVTISFTQAPESQSLKGTDTRADRTVSFSDSVVLRIDPTNSESVSPCE